MKICPTCRKTYADDNLNFCLEDGSVLTIASDDPPATVMMGQPRPTNPQPGFGQQPLPNTMQSSYGSSPQQYSMQPPRKSSKAWLWVLGIVGIVLLLCGGGFVGLIILGMQADKANNQNTTIPVNNSKWPTNNANSTSTPPVDGDVKPIDLTEWVKGDTTYGITEMVGDEFHMSAKKVGYYYVLVAPSGYTTVNASTRVTLRNIDNASSNLGYGLIFHSAPQPLQKDYALLIDTKRKKYRVVRHEPTKELPVVPWTTSNAIKAGSQENVLEARDKGDTVELYINDQMVTSIKDQFGHPNGVPGLYSGDAAKIGFKKLEIRK